MNTPKFPIIILSSVFILSACSSLSTPKDFGKAAGTALMIGSLVVASDKKDKETEEYDSNNKKAGGMLLGGLLIHYLLRDKEKTVKSNTKNNKNSNSNSSYQKAVISQAEKELSWRMKSVKNEIVVNFKNYKFINTAPYGYGSRPIEYNRLKSDELLEFEVLYLDSLKNSNVSQRMIKEQQSSLNKELVRRGKRTNWQVIGGVITGVVLTTGAVMLVRNVSTSTNTSKKKENKNNYSSIEERKGMYYVVCNEGAKQKHYIKDGYWYIGFWSTRTPFATLGRTNNKSSDYTPEEFANKVCK